MLAHIKLLVRAYSQIAAGPAGAEQDKSRGLVFGKIGSGAALVDRSAQQAACTRKAPALVADGWEVNAVVCGRVPDELIPAAGKTSLALGHLQHDQKRVAPLHAAARIITILWIVETAVLAVRRFTRLSAAEMA